MIKLLVDPRILVNDEGSDDYESLVQFWSLLVEWSADQRVVVGAETYAYVWKQLDARGYPDRDLNMTPRALRTEYRSALNKLLSRVATGTDVRADHVMTPQYLGSCCQHDALLSDVVCATDQDIRGIATREDSWAQMQGFVVIHPGPPHSLSLCMQPSAPIDDELRENIHARFAGVRLHIVGGQESGHVLAKIKHATGLDGRNILWLASEKSKPPRDLDRRWRNLDADRDIAICITGRIGHASSAAARGAAEKAGVRYIEVESANDIVKVLM